MTPPPWCAYARHSDRKQDSSVDQQIEQFRAYTAAHSLSLPDGYIFKDEARSGKTDAGRLALVQLMEFLEKRPRPVAGVLLWASSRLARNMDDSTWYKASIRRAGYKLVYVGDAMLNDITGPEGRLMEHLAEYRDEKYLEDLSRDVKRGMLSSLGKGGVGGRAPYGYRIERGLAADGSEISRWVADPATWGKARAAWEMRLAGASMMDIHKALHIFSDHKGYSYFFRSPTYRGALRWDGQVWENACPPVVTPAEWAAVQVINDERYNPRARASEFLLTGLLRCPTCGTGMIGQTSHSRKKTYHYYRCRKGPYGYHFNAGVHARPLEAGVLKQLKEHYFTEPILRPLIEQALASQTAAYAGRHETQAGIQKELAQVDNAIANLMRVVEQGAFASVASRLAEREAERRQLIEQIRELDTRGAPVPPAYNIPAICASARQILDNGTLAQQKALILRCVSAVYLDTPEGRIDFIAPTG